MFMIDGRATRVGKFDLSKSSHNWCVREFSQIDLTDPSLLVDRS